MENGKCLALVPYQPKRKEIKKTEQCFTRRKTLYMLFLFLNVTFIFTGYCFYKQYSSATDTDNLFGLIFSQSREGIYLSRGIRFLFTASLVMFLTSFTVFSPAVAVAFSVYLAFRAGMFFSPGCTFYQTVLVTTFIFFSIVYQTEVFMAYEKAKYGIKQLLKPQNVISVSVKTMIYTLIILLYGVAAGL